MIIPPGYAEFTVQLKHAAVSRPAFITGGVEIVDPGDTLTVADLISVCYTGAGSDFAELLDFDVTIGPVTAYIGQDGGPPLVATSTTTRLGGVSVNTLPANCSLLVHKRTARGGRRGRGRWFIPWMIQEAKIDEAGRITAPADITQLQGEMTALLAKHVEQGVPMVVLHSEQDLDNENSTAPGLPNTVTQLLVDPLVATQRRRLGR